MKTRHSNEVTRLVESVSAVRGSDFVGAFASGSQFVGLGNSRSNLNVYLVDRHANGQSGIPDFGLSTADLDVEHVNFEKLHAGVHAVRQGVPAANEITKFLRSKSIRELMVRFFYSEIVFDPAGKLANLKRQIVDAENEMRQQLICWRALECVNFRNDYIGATEAEDIDTADANSARLLNSSLQAFLAGCGEYYVGDKWTWAKLRRTGASNSLVSAAREATFPRLQETRRHQPQHRVELAQVLLAAAITTGWDTPGAAAWSTIPLTDKVTLSAEWFPMRFADRINMDHIDRAQTSISLAGLKLWANVVRGGREEAISHVAEEIKVSFVDVAKYLDSIVHRGMARFHE